MTEQEEIDEELDMSEMVQQIKDGQPKHTDVGWLQIFPQAKKRYGRFIKLRLRVQKMILEIQYELVEESLIRRLRQCADNHVWFREYIKDNGRQQLKDIEKQIRAIDHQLLVLKDIGKEPEEIKAKEKTVQINEAMIERARAYPLEKLVEINRQRFTRCFAHNDTKPSAYCKKNFIHCFVCQKSWDTIAVLRERDGMTFKQAVMQLQ